MIYKISHCETILCHFYNKEQKDNADRKNIQLNIEQCDVELTIACFQEFGLQLFPTVQELVQIKKNSEMKISSRHLFSFVVKLLELVVT